jgi:hypothetical protein
VTVLASLIVYRLVDHPLHLYFRKMLGRPKYLPMAIGQMPSVEQSKAG